MPNEDRYNSAALFADLARAVEPHWPGCSFQEQLLSEVGGDRDLAIVIYYHIGKHALDWLEEEVPALEGMTPRQCLQTEEAKRRLKDCLTRMP